MGLISACTLITWAAASSLSVTCSLSLDEDGVTLLVLKQAFNDTRNALRSWKATDITPCNWTGITCHSNDRRVHSIDLPYAQLGGTISPSIGKLSRLHRLALHQNSLHGYIPAEITNSTELRVLNLSTNFLSGEIPNAGHLGIFKNNSFVGNLDLCGVQVQKLCRSALGFPVVLPQSSHDDGSGVSELPQKRFSHYLTGVLIGAMSTMGLALVVLLSFRWICLLSRKGKLGERYSKIHKQPEQEAGAKLVTFHGDLPYSSYEIIGKLESMNE